MPSGSHIVDEDIFENIFSSGHMRGDTLSLQPTRHLRIIDKPGADGLGIVFNLHPALENPSEKRSPKQKHEQTLLIPVQLFLLLKFIEVSANLTV